MGTVYYRSDNKKWHVQIRHKDFKTISMCFETREEAVEFHDEMEEIMKKKVKERKIRLIKESL